MNTPPYHWIRKIEDAVALTAAIPLWGYPPPFPWEKFTERLSAAFSFPCKVDHHNTEWRAQGELTAGLGDRPIVIPVELEPLAGAVYWIMSAEDIAKLTSAALSSQNGFKGFTDRRLQEGFYRYLFLQALKEVDELNIYDDFSMHVRESLPLPQQGALCLDIQLTAGKQVLWGRLACPEPFYGAFKTHFAQKRPAEFPSALSQELELSIPLEAGHVSLSLEEWKQVACGDFILLERCSFDPTTHKGTATLVLNKIPLFRARLKPDAVKILDYAFYYEETMDHTPSDNPEDSGELSSDEKFTEEGIESEEHLWSTEPKKEGGAMEKVLSGQQITLTLTVEVARLQMSLEKLLQLKPGNTLDLAVKPEQGVQLTVNGKGIAKGELIKLGESLGVKILQIGIE